MRLWSLHPSYLDAKGLVALWREGLLAKAVLNGQTKGYKNHPQLERFKSHPQTQTMPIYGMWWMNLTGAATALTVTNWTRNLPARRYLSVTAS